MKPNFYNLCWGDSIRSFLIWLAGWADNEYVGEDPSLGIIAIEFIKFALSTNDIDSFRHVDVHVDDDDNLFGIIVDDTTYIPIYETSDHPDSIKADAENMLDSKLDQNKILLHLGNLPKARKEALNKNGYKLLDTKGLLEILTSVNTHNDFVNELIEYLKFQSNKDTYLHKPIAFWDMDDFEHLCMELEPLFPDSDWGYGEDSAFWETLGFRDFGSGLFCGFCWNFIDTRFGTLYMRLEKYGLYFMLEGYTNLSSTLLKFADNYGAPELRFPPESKNTPAHKPHAIAYLPREYYMEDRDIDISKLESTMKEYAMLLNEFARSTSEGRF